MKRRAITILLSLWMAILCSISPWSAPNKVTTATAATADLKPSSALAAVNNQSNLQTMAMDEQQITSAPKLDLGNHILNGSFNAGSNNFSTTSETAMTTITEANGNTFNSVSFDVIYSRFTSDGFSLKAATPYTFSFDYYAASDNPNQFAYGLSTIAGHPTAAQQIRPSGYAPYTVTNRDTGEVVQTLNTNTTLIHYGSGTRTMAVDGLDRNNNNETGGWRHFEVSFILSSDYPTAYFYFMSYEQGTVNGAALPFSPNKKISFDNINLKGLYSVSVASSSGGTASMEILDASGNAGKVYEGGRVKFTATPSNSYGFTGWKNTGGKIVSTELTYTARIYENTTLTATFTVLNSATSVITVVSSEGGTITSAQFGGTVTTTQSKEFQNGTAITLTAQSTGKNFIAWTNQDESPLSYNSTYTFYVNGSQTIKPLFDSGNGVYNGDFALGTDGWKTQGDTASNVSMNAMTPDELEAANIPAPPSGHSALKLSYNRTDGLLNKRVQAYSDKTFKTENNTTYEVSAWVYSVYPNIRLSFYVPTAQYPYQIDATNDFTYVGSGYNIGATQLAGTYQYLLNDKSQLQTGTYSAYTDPYRSFDSAGSIGGWTKVSLKFTTDSNANCVKNATVSFGIKSYSQNGINYTSGSAYFTDISVKKFSNYKIENNKNAGNATLNNKVVLSSLDGTAKYGDLLTLNADNYNGFIFNGWYKDGGATPFTTNKNVSTIYTGNTTFKAKYSYDTTVPNFQLGDFESIMEPTDTPTTQNDGDVNGDNKINFMDITILSRYIAKWSNLNYVQEKLDVSGDGEIDFRDITYLSRLIAGWNIPLSTVSSAYNVWKLLSEQTANTPAGQPLSWGSFSVTDGVKYSTKPHGGNAMLALNGSGNYSTRRLDVTANTNYLLTFYWYQNVGDTNALNSVAVTTNNSAVTVGSPAEYANPSLTNEFLGQDFTSVRSNGTWRKYSLSFNSKDNTVLQLFIKFTADTTVGPDYLFLDDFSLLPYNTETASGTVASLSVSNQLAPLNTTFTGISSTVYHCYTFMDDRLGRNYTDEMAALEMDRLRDTGTRLVRSIFKSWFAWDDTTGTWNWESQRMKDAYQWALELQKRGINIALNASWSLPYLVSGTSTIPEVPYLYANGDYTLACARYGEWMKQALQAFEAHGVHNITHLIVFTEPSRYTSTQLEGPDADEYVQAINALDTALRSAGIRNNYKLVGPNQGSITTGEGLLNYALQHCDSAIDIYSTHFYPRSLNATDDVYGSLTASTYASYMNVMKRNNSIKDFWSDEYFAAATNSPLGTDSSWCGTQTAVGMTSAMNAGIEGMISWQLFDQLWVDQTNTGGEFTDGIHVCGTAPSLFTSAVPRTQYYALTLLSKYFGYKNGKAYTSTSPSGSGLYISCAQLEDGTYTVMVVNAGATDKKVQVDFATAINQTLYRHLFDPGTIKPDARAKVIGADKVYNQVGTSFVDTIPSGGVAIYTGLGY